MAFQCSKAGPNDLPGSLWVTGDAVTIDLDPDEIESLFKKPAKKKKGGPQKPKKPEPVSVIDAKKSNNCGIALSRVKLPFEELMKALIACDPFALAPGEGEEAACDMCELLVNIAPDDADMKEIDGYLANPKNDPELLADVEQFFIKITKVPGNLSNRLACMNMMLTLESRIFSAKSHVEEKILACSTIFEGLGVPKCEWAFKPEPPPEPEPEPEPVAAGPPGGAPRGRGGPPPPPPGGPPGGRAPVSAQLLRVLCLSFPTAC
jgi:hypothetical protein